MQPDATAVDRLVVVSSGRNAFPMTGYRTVIGTMATEKLSAKMMMLIADGGGCSAPPYLLAATSPTAIPNTRWLRKVKNTFRVL